MKLPKEVVQFLLDNPHELEHVKSRMIDAEERRTRPARIAAEKERRAKLPLAPCNGLGYKCSNLTPGGYTCESCLQEYRDDPDAFK